MATNGQITINIEQAVRNTIRSQVKREANKAINDVVGTSTTKMTKAAVNKAWAEVEADYSAKIQAAVKKRLLDAMPELVEKAVNAIIIASPVKRATRYY